MPSVPSVHPAGLPQHHSETGDRDTNYLLQESGSSSERKDRPILTPMRSPRRPSGSPNPGSKEQSADEDLMNVSPSTTPTTKKQPHSLALRITDAANYMETDQNQHGSVEGEHHVQKKGADVESEEDLEPLRRHVPPPRSHVLVDDRKSPPPSPSSTRLHLRARSGSRTSYPGGGANSPILHSGPSSPSRSPKAHLKPLFPQDLHQRAMSPPPPELRKSPPPHSSSFYGGNVSEPRTTLHRHHRGHQTHQQAIPTPPLSATTASLIFPLAPSSSGSTVLKLPPPIPPHSYPEIPRVETASPDHARNQSQPSTASASGSKSHQKRIQESRNQKPDESSSSNTSRQTEKKFSAPQQRSEQTLSPLSRRATLPSPRTPSSRHRADISTSPKIPSEPRVSQPSDVPQSSSRTSINTLQPAYPPSLSTPPISTPSASAQNKQHVCQICTLAFARAHDLKRHTTTHTGEKNFVCQNCLKKYARKDALKRHACTRAPPAGGAGVTGSASASGGGGGSVMGLGAGAGLGAARTGLVSVGHLRPPSSRTIQEPLPINPGYHGNAPPLVGAAAAAMTSSGRPMRLSPSPPPHFRDHGGRPEGPESSTSRSRFADTILRRPSPSLSPPSLRRSSPSSPQTMPERKTDAYNPIQSRNHDMDYPLPPLLLPPLPRPRAPSETGSESGSDSLRASP